jgi:hypothetical protein
MCRITIKSRKSSKPGKQFIKNHHHYCGMFQVPVAVYAVSELAP